MTLDGSRRQPIPVLPCPHASAIELLDGTHVCITCDAVIPPLADVERFEFSGLVVQKQDGRVVLEMREVRS